MAGQLIAPLRISGSNGVSLLMVDKTPAPRHVVLFEF